MNGSVMKSCCLTAPTCFYWLCYFFVVKHNAGENNRSVALLNISFKDAEAVEDVPMLQ